MGEKGKRRSGAREGKGREAARRQRGRGDSRDQSFGLSRDCGRQVPIAGKILPGVSLLFRCRTDFHAGFFGGGFKSGASLLPGFVVERHGAFALTFAFVLTGGGTAASLAFAGVFAFAGVGFGGGTGSLAGAVVIAFTFALAGVQPATRVRVLKDDRQVLFVIGGTGDGSFAGDQTADGTDREFVKKRTAAGGGLI